MVDLGLVEMGKYVEEVYYWLFFWLVWLLLSRWCLWRKLVVIFCGVCCLILICVLSVCMVVLLSCLMIGLNSVVNFGWCCMIFLCIIGVVL